MYLLNRLDSPASGLIIGATTRELAEYVKNCFLNKKIDKLYHAIVFNSRLKINSPWRDTIKVTRKSGKLRSQVDSPQGDFALTHVRLSSSPSENSNCALIELRPVTGRTHQLRVQCAKRKFPIVGDSTYGDFRLNRELQKITGSKRLFLHASHIRIPLEDDKETDYFEAESKLPPVFYNLINKH